VLFLGIFNPHMITIFKNKNIGQIKTQKRDINKNAKTLVEWQ